EARAFDRRELWVRQPGRVVEVQQLALVAQGEDAQGVLEVLVLAKTLQIVCAVDLTEDPGLHNLCRTEVQVVRIFVLGGAVEKQTELDRGRLLPGQNQRRGCQADDGNRNGPGNGQQNHLAVDRKDVDQWLQRDCSVV